MQQRRHRDLPAVADAAEDVLLRHLDVGEEDLVELGVARDLHERPHLDARRVHVDDHVGQVLVLRRVGVALADEDAEVGDVRERRPDLLAVDEEVVALVLDPRASRGEVAAGVRLREALAPDLLGAEDLREVALLLLLRAPRDDRRAGHAEADHAEVRRRLGACELFEEDRLVAVRRAGAAVLLRPGQPGVPGLAELLAPLTVGVLEAAGAARLRAVRQVLRDEVAHLLAEGSLVGGVAQIHVAILTPAGRAVAFGRARDCPRDLARADVFRGQTQEHVPNGQRPGAASPRWVMQVEVA